MKSLFDSNGYHIANELNGQLYSPYGQNIGHFLESHRFYIDMQGYYLGEIIFNDRLMHRDGNGYDSVSFGNYGNYGNIGNYGNPGNVGSIGRIAGYSDIDGKKLK
jgi:hypothetical protein